jgi:hypothetical protein
MSVQKHCSTKIKHELHTWTSDLLTPDKYFCDGSAVDPTVQVPASLIKQAPHERTCASFSWNGVGWDHDEGACDCWKAGLLTPPAARPEEGDG